jgi:hypothetical protein
MAKPIYIRPYNKDTDALLLATWLYAGRDENLFDPGLFERKQVMIFTAFDETGVVGFIPVAVVYLVESLAFRPGLPDVTKTKALLSFQQVLVSKAAEGNVPDAFCVAQDERFLRFMERYGWRRPVAAMRNLHFADFERRPPEDDHANNA